MGIQPGEKGVLDAAHDARPLVIGLADRWQSEGIGSVRLAVAAAADVPTLFVRTRSPAERHRTTRDADPLHVDARLPAH